MRLLFPQGTRLILIRFAMHQIGHRELCNSEHIKATIRPIQEMFSQNLCG